MRLPAELEGKILVVRATLGETADARLVVDSGAGTSALSVACAQRLNLSMHERLRVRTPTGLTQVGTFVTPISVGSLSLPALRMAAVPLHNDNVDGLLGLDFFRAIGARSVTVRLDTAEVEVELT